MLNAHVTVNLTHFLCHNGTIFPINYKVVYFYTQLFIFPCNFLNCFLFLLHTYMLNFEPFHSYFIVTHQKFFKSIFEIRKQKSRLLN